MGRASHCLDVDRERELLAVEEVGREVRQEESVEREDLALVISKSARSRGFGWREGVEAFAF